MSMVVKSKLKTMGHESDMHDLSAEVDPPASSLHVHCTDVDGEWLVWGDKGEYRMLPVHDKGDAAIRGPAANIWLLLMGRLDRSKLDVVGDASAAAAWLDLPNW